MSEKLCVFCKRFSFTPAEPGYSELTPGYDASISCGAGRWFVNNYRETTESFREKILTARECEDYEPPEQS